MLIDYMLANGDTIEIEVTEEVGSFYLSSVETEKSNDRANTRTDRHTSLDTLTYEDARFFGDGTDIEGDYIDAEFAERAFAGLTDLQREYVRLCIIDGWSYTDVARRDGKSDVAVGRTVKRALAHIEKNLR